MRRQVSGLNRWLKLLCGLLLFFAGSLQAGTEPLWFETDAAGQRQVHLYFFWTKSCPHCQAARPFIEALPARHEWLRLHSHEVSADRGAANTYVAMAEALGQDASSVPAFLFCGRMEVGFDTPETTGRALEDALLSCRDAADATPAVDTKITPKSTAPVIEIPGIGAVNPEQMSLPVFTIIIAGLDAFNPCAFFVLLFLLSLLIHAGSRARMLYIGGVFLLFSGLIYFLFMAAWLNIFRWLGEITLVTTLAGCLALLVALINIKEYFWFKQGVSLSIPDSAKPGLYQRVRGLLRADSLPALTAGTIALAIAANSYELLCTAGFPMIYTRLLTLADLSPWQHYAYLGFYNLIYVIPLIIITVLFTFTLGSRKLSEEEGRILKLVSGFMMLGLGVLMVWFPAALNDLRVALGLLAGALIGAGVTHRIARWRSAREANAK